jgi:hypothetical protein
MGRLLLLWRTTLLSESAVTCVNGAIRKAILLGVVANASLTGGGGALTVVVITGPSLEAIYLASPSGSHPLAVEHDASIEIEAAVGSGRRRRRRLL